MRRSEATFFRDSGDQGIATCEEAFGGVDTGLEQGGMRGGAGGTSEMLFELASRHPGARRQRLHIQTGGGVVFDQVQGLAYYRVVMGCPACALTPHDPQRRHTHNGRCIVNPQNQTVGTPGRLIALTPVVQGDGRERNRRKLACLLRVLVDDNEGKILGHADAEVFEGVDKTPGESGVDKEQAGRAWQAADGLRNFFRAASDILVAIGRQRNVFEGAFACCQPHAAVGAHLDRVRARSHPSHPLQSKPGELIDRQPRAGGRIVLDPRYRPIPSDPPRQMNRGQPKLAHPAISLVHVDKTRDHRLPSGVAFHPIRPHRPTRINTQAMLARIGTRSIHNARTKKIHHDTKYRRVPRFRTRDGGLCHGHEQKPARSFFNRFRYGVIAFGGRVHCSCARRWGGYGKAVNEAPVSAAPRIRRVGRRLLRDGRPWFARGVAYGPFPTSAEEGWLFSGTRLRDDLRRMREAGFDCLRTFHPPTDEVLDCCAEEDLVVWCGLDWSWQRDFSRHPELVKEAARKLAGAAGRVAGHPAVAGWVVANEIEASMVRWMGANAARRALDHIITAGRGAAPEHLFLHASYPLTEQLVADGADVLGMNLYLEDETALRSYLSRLHHVAGNRPLLITEFGIDRLARGFAEQARWLRRGFAIAAEAHTAGMLWFNWSDAWRDARTGTPVTGWRFGLTDEQGRPHESLEAMPTLSGSDAGSEPFPGTPPEVSILICTRNGGARLERCLAALSAIEDPANRWEVLVVDDGSTDDTAERVRQCGCRNLRAVSLPPAGLGAARNVAAAHAKGRWLAFLDDDCVADPLWLTPLVRAAEQNGWAAAGGPNLPPPDESGLRRVINRLPGSASPVLLDDIHAEHVPGCNLLVRANVFHSIGGFDSRFHTAGDDVDFCWRLLDAGHRIGFEPAAFVWHERRATLSAFLRQQYNYGLAEAMLADKWNGRGGRDRTGWSGTVYDGLPRSHRATFRNPSDADAYPVVYDAGPAPRPRPEAGRIERLAHRLLCLAQPFARALGRWKGGLPMRMPAATTRPAPPPRRSAEDAFWHDEGLDRTRLQEILVEAARDLGCTVTLNDGWDDWDVRWEDEGGSGSALFVTEYTEKKGRMTRIRYAGHATDLRRQVRRTAAGEGFVIQ